MKYSIEDIQINSLDENIINSVKENWNSIIKPLNGMGKFEEYISRIGAIQNTTRPDIGKRAILVYAADNGIVEEGISQSDQDMTAICAEGIARGEHSVAVMARSNSTDVRVIDVGIASDSNINNRHKIRRGTRNFAKEPAMTREELLAAIWTGTYMVKECMEAGYTLLGVGEMGIGNTTTSTAVACGMLGLTPGEVVGRGAGLDDIGLARKKKVIEYAITRYDLTNKDTLEIMECVGGFDIAAMAGTYIGGALYGVPIVMDGVISSVAALVAERIAPGTSRYIIPSHISREHVMNFVCGELGFAPVIDGSMALGEGTGAVMMIALLDTAMSVYNHAARFGDKDLEPYSAL